MNLIKEEIIHSKKSLRKFRKSKFNYKKFLKEFYLEDNNAYISVKVKNYNDIISKYSINNYEWLDKDFAEYIEENAYYIPVEYDIVLEICGPKFTKEEQEKIVKTIKMFFGLKLGDKELDLKINKRKSNILLICGILSLLFLLYLNKYIVNIYIEPALVSFWFFMWEYIEVFFLERTELKIKKTEAGQLSNLSITFNEEV